MPASCWTSKLCLSDAEPQSYAGLMLSHQVIPASWSAAHAEPLSYDCLMLTHWGRVTHLCASKLTTIGSDNGLSPGRRQAIIWTNDGILLIRTLGTIFSEILSEIHSFWFKKMHLKMSSAKWRLFLLGLIELTHWGWDKMAAISQTTFSIAFSWMKWYEFRLRFHWNLFQGFN